jgi:type 1 glutamine amidotransferase
MIHIPCLLALGLTSTPAPAAGAAGAEEKIPVLLVGGANNHWWEWTHESLEGILRESDKFVVTLTTEPEKTLANAEELARYRAFVLDYNGPRWGAEAEANFLRAVRGGAGVVVVHAADNAFEGWKEYEELVGLCWRVGAGHGRFHPFDVRVVDREHPITRDMPDLRAHPDELYHGLTRMHGAEPRVLASAFSSEESGGSGRDEPMVVVSEFGSGRVFHTPLGHVWRGNESDKRSHLDPQFRDLIVRGTEWAATGEVTPGRHAAGSLTAAEREAGWQSLFDGKTGAGWRSFRGEAFPAEGWEIEDGSLHKVAGAGGGDLVTTGTWADFEFRFEWRVAEGANSGVMFRVDEEHDYPWQTGAEYQILDDERHADGKEPRTSAASLYALVAGEGKRLSPVGEWNHGRILVIGNHAEHWLNGVKVVEYEIGSDDWNALVGASKFASMPDFGLRPSGHIALQDHGDDVWFRNLAIRDLDFDSERSIALFDGKTLSGWTHHLQEDRPAADVWNITPEGVLVCKGQPIGYLRTERDWTNYALRLEWRFDPEKGAGNSGVLLRQIGPDKVWPRSIEAQLQSGAAGDFWNIDEFPMQVAPESSGRTHGRNTKGTGTNEKLLGEWNTYDITVWHGFVVLRVNGRILNEARRCLEIPGKICLQSEGAEIHFREIRLTPLP